MRRKDREITSLQEKISIIDNCKVCRLAVKDDKGLYIVPMNFGYIVNGCQLILYFHSAESGRKISAMKSNPYVAFEMDCGHKLLKANTACAHSYSYKSVTGDGKVEFVDNIDEKKTALTLLMRHQSGVDYTFADKEVKSICVFKIVSDEFSAKAN